MSRNLRRHQPPNLYKATARRSPSLAKACWVFLTVLALVIVAEMNSPPSQAAGPEWTFPTTGTAARTYADNPVELGLESTPKLSGTISAIRFYKPRQSSGPYSARLWDDRGGKVAEVRFPAVSSEGWQTAILSPSAPVSAGEKYTVSYSAPKNYAATGSYFNGPTDTAYLQIPRAAGVYQYALGERPTNTFDNSNYHVDVQFTPQASSTPTATAKPTSTDSTPPEVGSKWIFPSTGTFPRADPDTSAVELGLRFTPMTSGTVSAIRFYKPSQSSGPYTARLWDDRGEKVAEVSFPAGSAEGWQTAVLSPAAHVTAGRQYTASYSAPRGRYAAATGYFSEPIETTYLSIPRAAGVYRYAIEEHPTQTYNNANYYIDVEFAPANPATPNATEGPTTADPTPTQESPTNPGTGAINLPQEPWHGGPDYYAKFPKAAAAGWTDPSFFPISVFFGKPSHAAALKSVGVNTYMGAEHDGSSMSSITGEGIFVLAQAEWTPAEVGNDARVVGWHVSDECDMGLSGCDQGDGEYGSLEVHRGYANRLRALNDGRFLHANFGNGVLGTYWSRNTMKDHIALVDSSSVDKYAYTSPHVQDLIRQSPYWPAGRNPESASAYGWLQDRMETFANPVASKPDWVFVETAKPYLGEDGATSITGDQLEGAVWNAIIHGASGIAYFQHNNNGQCGNYSLVECSEELRDKVTQVNSQVESLAPVLNTPSYRWKFGDGLDTSLKAHADNAYILAMPDGGSGARTFTLPPGIKGAHVEVVGENRIIPVSNSMFTDTFAAEHDHHVYRISLKESFAR